MGKLLSKENQETTETDGASQELEVPHEQTPTVYPFPEDDFKPEEDAKNLNTALQSFGANETAITNILANRSSEQRKDIRDAYNETFHKTLISEVDAELSGNYKQALEWLLLDIDSVRANYVSSIVNESALARLAATQGKDVAVLETIYTLTKTELHDLRKAYEKESNTQLFKDIEDKVTGPFKDWIVEMTKTGRNEGSPSTKAIEKDVAYLKSITPDTWSPEEEEIKKIFCKQNIHHVYAVLTGLQSETGSIMENVVEKVKKDYRDGFTAIVSACLNSYEFFADGLYLSMKGIGTNNHKLIYIMIDRSEFDLENIRIEFEIKYKKSLRSFIKEDTSGDFKNLLLAILDIPETAKNE